MRSAFVLMKGDVVLTKRHSTRAAAIAEAYSHNFSVKGNTIVVGRSARDGRVFLLHPYYIKEVAA